MAEMETQHVRYGTAKFACLTLAVATCTYLLQGGLCYIQTHMFFSQKRDMLCINPQKLCSISSSFNSPRFYAIVSALLSS